MYFLQSLFEQLHTFLHRGINRWRSWGRDRERGKKGRIEVQREGWIEGIHNTRRARGKEWRER
jgi:hypothetical protein